MKNFWLSLLFISSLVGTLVVSVLYNVKEEPSIVLPSKNFIERQDSIKAENNFWDLIQYYAKESKIDPYLVDAVMRVESNYNWRAVSKAGAIGLMQLMQFNVKYYDECPETVNLFDPKHNIRIGCEILAYHLHRTSLDNALASYNAGEFAVKKYCGIPPYKETEAFVKRVKSLYIPNVSKLKRGECD